MNHGLVGLALAAGLVAALNPCGFAMLPAYLLFVVRGQQPGEPPTGGSVRRTLLPLVRALAATTGMGLGFLTVFGLFGALTISAAATVHRFIPYATVLIGAILVVLGLWLLTGRELTALMPSRFGTRWAPTVRLGSMYGYGVSYAIASLSCTIGPFLAVTAAGLRGGSIATDVAIYLSYVAGLTLVVGVLAVAAAAASSALAERFRRVVPFVNRMSGVLLVLVGAYVSYYGSYELRLFSATSATSATAAIIASPDAVITVAGRIQGALAGWVHQHGVWPWVAASAVLALGVFAGARRRRVGRRLSYAPSTLANDTKVVSS